jgi:hypothetical protein
LSHVGDYSSVGSRITLDLCLEGAFEQASILAKL